MNHESTLQVLSQRMCSKPHAPQPATAATQRPCASSRQQRQATTYSECRGVGAPRAPTGHLPGGHHLQRCPHKHSGEEGAGPKAGCLLCTACRSAADEQAGISSEAAACISMQRGHAQVSNDKWLSVKEGMAVRGCPCRFWMSLNLCDVFKDVQPLLDLIPASHRRAHGIMITGAQMFWGLLQS